MHEIRTKSFSYPKIPFLKKTMQIVVSLLLIKLHLLLPSVTSAVAKLTLKSLKCVWPVCLTCGVRLAVVLPAVFHLDWRQADRLHHLVCPFAPIRGAESPDGQREGQRGEEQRQQGAVTSGHFLQHDCVSTQKQPNEK